MKFLMLVIALFTGNTYADDQRLPADAVFQAITPIDIAEEYLDSEYDDIGLLLAEFPNESSAVYLGQREDSGAITYGVGSVSVKNLRYQVVVDYAKYRIGIHDSSENFVKKGVGLRVKASFTAKESGVDLGSLFAVGVAGQAKKIVGDISVESIGISGPEITPLIPITTQIDISAIQQIMQSVAAIKSKIYANEGVTISPQIFAVQEIETTDSGLRADAVPAEGGSVRDASQLKTASDPQWLYVGHFDYDSNSWISGPYLSQSGKSVAGLPNVGAIYDVNSEINVRAGYPSFPLYRLKVRVGTLVTADKVKVLRLESIGKNKVWVKVKVQ